MKEQKIEPCPLCNTKPFRSVMLDIDMLIVETLTCPECNMAVTGYGDDAIKVWNLASKAAKKAKERKGKKK